MKYGLCIVVLLLAFSCLLAVTDVPYTIQLQWDEIDGECNGILSGKIGNDTGVVQGAGKGSALKGRIVSQGESAINEQGQVFQINCNEGYFSFWVRDKFADDDIAADPYLLSNAKPVISLFRGEELLQTFNLSEGYGLTCKVFTLDAENGIVMGDMRYFMQTKSILVMVVNAVDGNPIEGAEITLSGGDENSQSFTSDDSGVISFPVEIGSYRVSIGKDGYIPTSYPVAMGFDENPVELVVALCPEVKEYRIVLTWGSSPADLDAHLAGPKPEGGDFHIWYRNRILIAGRDFLDRDDTNRYGPETITIYKPAEGEYTYAVHDYTDRQNSRSKALSFSNAVAQVYAENKLLYTFQVPENINGTLWKVFKIDSNHRIIPINSLTWIEDERNILH